jgi:hypothetical protein
MLESAQYAAQAFTTSERVLSSSLRAAGYGWEQNECLAVYIYEVRIDFRRDGKIFAMAVWPMVHELSHARLIAGVEYLPQ